jgi:hypothetical protein
LEAAARIQDANFSLHEGNRSALNEAVCRFISLANLLNAITHVLNHKEAAAAAELEAEKKMVPQRTSFPSLLSDFDGCRC